MQGFSWKKHNQTTSFSVACRDQSSKGSELLAGWLGWRTSRTQGAQPTLTLLSMGTHPMTPCTPLPPLHPFPLSSFFINTIISWLLPVLFVLFLLSCLHWNFLSFTIPWPYLRSHCRLTPWAHSTHWGALQGFLPGGAAHCRAILNLMFVSYLQDNIGCWLTWIKEKNPALLH